MYVCTCHIEFVDSGKFSRMKRVLMAMSGGVDSSVSALLLKRQGYEVHGVLMKNWDHGEEGSECSYERDYRDVDWVCHKIGIEYSVIDFTKEYWNFVFQPYLRSHNQGYTPNADVACNKCIKFNFLFKQLTVFSASYLATGHYARTDDGDRLIRGRDVIKDQSYFLALTDPLVFSKVLFPVGDMLKSEVQQIARDENLDPILARKESMGLCFVGKRRKFHQFLSQYIPYQVGNAFSLEDEYVGTHMGYQFYTIGQRARLQGQRKGTYVVAKDAKSNSIYVVDDYNHASLYSKRLRVEYASSLKIDKFPFLCCVQTRYSSIGSYCIVRMYGDGVLDVECVFDSIRAVTPGQIAVFYLGDVCLGGSVIVSRQLENCPTHVRDTFIDTEPDQEGRVSSV